MDNQSILSQAIISSLIILASGVATFYLLFFLLKQWIKKKKTYVITLLDKHIHLAGILLFISITSNIVFEKFETFILPSSNYNKISHLIEIMLIISIGFFIMKVVELLKDWILHYYERRNSIDYSLRSAKTKYQLLQHIASLIITLCIIVAILITFPQIRKVGGALIASAGVAGIILGFAAQKSLGSLFAGIQIAIAQPIKIDDTIEVENTFGTVGEITLTYVVINTWDEKRFIVPVNYFLEKPFVNWTRNSPEVIGKVNVYADYTLPMDEIRTAFDGWIEKSTLWDKRKADLLISDANDKTIELRATMSAKNSDDAFGLECYIREKLVTFIQEKYPQALPSARIKNISINDSEKNQI